MTCDLCGGTGRWRPYYKPRGETVRCPKCDPAPGKGSIRMGDF